MRKLLLFGNGLGRSIDPDFFLLERALSDAWNDPSCLNAETKALICQCLPEKIVEDDIDSGPQSEEDLDALQRVLAACDEISRFESTASSQKWLTELGRSFPNAIRSFVHRVASTFHRGGHQLPSTFIDSLKNSVVQNRHHVATLNYDEILYNAFVGTPLFDRYNCLIDGFVGPFDNSNLDRYHKSSQSFYLHLHGSPLYYDSPEGEILKASMGEIPALQGYSSTHVVLTHIRHKPTVISASEVLRSYWLRLEEALTEAEGILLFGYSGQDSHLNRLVSQKMANKQIEIVERQVSQNKNEHWQEKRLKYWTTKLGKSPTISWHENILDHKEWNDKKPDE